MTKYRYKLHWNSGDSNRFPKCNFKWVIYDWKLICPIAFFETRKLGRIICNLLNKLNND